MEYIIEPLQYDFMLRAIVVSTLVGIVSALLSCFMMLKRWSLVGDAVSHSVLPGVVIAYAIGIPFSIGAFVFGLAGVLGIGFIKERVRLKEDAVIGVVYTTLFALGVVLISLIPSNIDLQHILFGYVLGISTGDAIQVGVISTVVIITILAFRKSFLLYAFDQSHAKAIRLRVGFYHYLLLVMLALTVVASVQTVGIILVIAMLVIPGSIAHLLTDDANSLFAVAVASSVIACITGAYLSYYFDISTGGSMVLVLSALFAITFLFAPKYGAIVGRRG